MVVLLSTAVGQTMAYGEEKAEPSHHDRIYYFQHRLLPDWVHNSNGQFFSDLESGIHSKILDAAKEIVDVEFSEALRIESIPEKKAHLITFQTPIETPECFFILIKKEDKGFAFYTLEKSFDLFGKGYQSVVGMWTPEGVHLNLGERKYITLDEFLDEILSKKKVDNNSVQ